MTVITNNIMQGPMDSASPGTGSGFIPAGVKNIAIGNPSGVAITQTGSDIIWDSANGNYFIAQDGIGGSNWIKLGSVA